MELELSGQIFDKPSNMKCLENPSSGSGSRYFSMRTDRHDEANNRFSQLSNAPKKLHFVLKVLTFPTIRLSATVALHRRSVLSRSSASNVICRYTAMLWRVESALGSAHRATHITALTVVSSYNDLTFWRRNYFFNFSTHCILNVNNTGTKQVRIMKQTAF